jgi:hypothetical protein
LFGRESAEHRLLAMFQPTHVAVDFMLVGDRQRNRLSPRQAGASPQLWGK